MNTIKKLMMIMALLVTTMGAIHAQKVGHVNTQELITALPESKTNQELLMKFQKEYEEELAMMESIYKKKVEEFQAKAKIETTQKEVLTTLQNDIVEYEQRIYGRREQIEADLQKKEAELFQPILQKVKDAIGKVSKEQGVNYVFDTQVLVFYDGGTDLQPLVKKELGIQ